MLLYCISFTHPLLSMDAKRVLLILFFVEKTLLSGLFSLFLEVTKEVFHDHDKTVFPYFVILM